MICPHCNKYFKDEGRAKGGKKSKRTITPEQQAKMQASRNSVKDKNCEDGAEPI